MSDVQLKTRGIKLSDLRPCDSCGGKIAPIFRVVSIRHAVVNQRNANAVLGLMHAAQWGVSAKALAVAEAMSPYAESAVEVLENPEATTELFICQECLCRPVCLAELAEKRSDAIEAQSPTK